MRTRNLEKGQNSGKLAVAFLFFVLIVVVIFGFGINPPPGGQTTLATNFDASYGLPVTNCELSKDGLTFTYNIAGTENQPLTFKMSSPTARNPNLENCTSIYIIGKRLVVLDSNSTKLLDRPVLPHDKK